MNNAIRLLPVGLLVIGLGSAATDAQAGRIKCWTNKDGVRECGNAVPPEYAQKGHEELSKQGVVIDRQARAKTQEEMAEERRRAEEARLAEERARERAALDRVLLDTFTSEDDLRLATEGRLQAIESRIGHTERVVGKLRTNLAALEREAANLERSGKPVSAGLREQIGDVQRQIDDNLGFIEDRRKEQATVEEKFQADLARYRELRAAGR